MDLSSAADVIYKYLLAPVVMFVWWLFKKYDTRLDAMEQRINRIETETAILETKLDSLKAGIDDIKAQLQRMFDMLESRR